MTELATIEQIVNTRGGESTLHSNIIESTYREMVVLEGGLNRSQVLVAGRSLYAYQKMNPLYLWGEDA